jgi:hypothetical protein
MENIVELLTHIDKLITISFWFCAICIFIYFGFQILKYTAAIILGLSQRKKLKRKEKEKNERTESQT